MNIDEIKSAFAEQLKPLHARLDAVERSKTTANAAGITDAAPAAAVPAQSVTVRDAADGTGLHFVRALKAQWQAKATGAKASEIAKGRGYAKVAAFLESQEKALVQGNFANGGALVVDEFYAELIPLLRNRVTVLAAGARVIQMGASLTIPRQTSAGTAYWGNEGTAILESQQAVGSLQLQEKKLTALTGVSNDLMRNASLSADQLVRDDLVNVIAIAKDLAFLRGSGAAGRPRGIRYWLNSNNVFNETITTAGSPTLAEVRKELAKLKRLILAGNVPFTKPAFFGTARTMAALEAIVDGNGNAVYYAGLNSPSPQLLGIPFFRTQQLPETINSGGTADTGGTRSELYLVDMDQVLVGESMALEVEVFPNGTYVSGGSARSGISFDETVIRAIEKTDLVMRYDLGGAVVNNLSWT